MLVLSIQNDADSYCLIVSLSTAKVKRLLKIGPFDTIKVFSCNALT